MSSEFYGLDGTVSSADWFAGFEWMDLGELAGRDVVHLQCHLDTETVVFAERGARTVGLDISPESIMQARPGCHRAGLHFHLHRRARTAGGSGLLRVDARRW